MFHGKDVRAVGRSGFIVEPTLAQLVDPRRDALLTFHEAHRHLMKSAPGSRSKHQAWDGGYLDHIGECFKLAGNLYPVVCAHGPVEFSLESALVVLYLHDIEKPFRYSKLSPGPIDKEVFLEALPRSWGISLSADEQNGLRYVHGEPDSEYNPNTRLMGPLASFCHAVDNLSARLFFDRGR